MCPVDRLCALQVHNALGFAYFNMDRTELATKNYRKAIELQPGYTTAWNNLGDAYEKIKDWDQVRMPWITLIRVHATASECNHSV